MILNKINKAIFDAIKHQGEEDEIMELVTVRKEYMKNVSKKQLKKELDYLITLLSKTPKLNDLVSHVVVQMAKDTSTELTARGVNTQRQIKFIHEQGTDILSKVVPTIIHEGVTSYLIEKGYAYELSDENPILPSKPLLRVLNRLK